MDEIQIKVYVIIVSVYLLASFSLLIGRIMVYCVCLYVRPCFALIVLYVFTISMKRDITQKKKIGFWFGSPIFASVLPFYVGSVLIYGWFVHGFQAKVAPIVRPCLCCPLKAMHYVILTYPATYCRYEMFTHGTLLWGFSQFK